MALSWTTVGNTIRSWIVTASGIPDGNVIWANQNGHRPLTDFITVKLSGPRRVTLTDDVSYDFDEDRPAGQEIEFRAAGLREFTISIQAYTAAPRGDSGAVAVLGKLLGSLALNNTIDSLMVSGISIFDTSDIKDLSALLDADFEGRALIEARAYVVDDSHYERTTYIETINATLKDASTEEEATITLHTEDDN